MTFGGNVAQLVKRLLSSPGIGWLFLCAAVPLAVLVGMAWMPAFVLAGLAGCKSARSPHGLGGVVRPRVWNLRLAVAYGLLVYWIGAFILRGHPLLSLAVGLVLGVLAIMTWPGESEDSE